MVPVPTCSSFAELNDRLEASCRADLFRRVRGKPGTKADPETGVPTPSGTAALVVPSFLQGDSRNEIAPIPSP